MKKRPILFTGDMVRAILDGRPTQTRRVIKPQPIGRITQHPLGRWYPANFKAEPVVDKVSWLCPYGVPGDRLWVKEAWQHEDMCCDDHKCGQPSHIYHKATEVAPETFASWRSPIFMPRWASRITVEIVGVRVERVQEISRDDAIAEGIEQTTGDHEYDNRTSVENFALLWNSLNAKRGFSWESNPWVWVIEFRISETEPRP